MNDEHRLLQDIMSTYSKKNLLGRPVQNVSEAITVKMGVSLQQILNVDEKNSVLILQVWMNFVSITRCMVKIDGEGGGDPLEQW